MAKAMGGLGDVLGKAGKEFGEMLSASVKGQKINGTYKAINHLGNNYLGAPEAIYKMTKGKQGIGEALTKTFATNGDDLYKNGKRIADAKANWNYGKIAGSYIGVSAAARVATGGGLYKDKNGNTNVAGVPFI